MNAMSWNLLRKLRVRYIRARVGRCEAVPTCDCAVVVAPHPDDEVFGCAGLMSRMRSEGKHVELIVMTGGGKSHSSCCGIDEDDLIEKRRELTRKAASRYGLAEEHIHFLNYPDGGVQFSDENTKELMQTLTSIEKAMAGKDVAVFFPHSLGEGWDDHIRTSEITRQLCASIFQNAKLFEYCVWFWFYGCMSIDWRHAKVVRLSESEYRKKQEAIHVYMDVLAPCGKPWSGNLPKMFMWAMKWKKELFFLK